MTNAVVQQFSPQCPLQRRVFFFFNLNGYNSSMLLTKTVAQVSLLDVFHSDAKGK